MFIPIGDGKEWVNLDHVSDAIFNEPAGELCLFIGAPTPLRLKGEDAALALKLIRLAAHKAIEYAQSNEPPVGTAEVR